MFEKDWRERPNGAAYRALVFDRWWSRGEAQTDAQGAATFRVFKGRHEVTVTHGGQTRTVPVETDEASTTLTVTLEP
jgi:hypothetical protein